MSEEKLLDATPIEGEPIKEPICEEMRLQDGWYQKAMELTSTGEAQAFMEGLLTDYGHDYGTACHAVTAALLATAKVMVQCLPELRPIHAPSAPSAMQQELQAKTMIAHIFTQLFLNNGPIRILQHHFMLFPENASRFEKIVDEETLKYLKNTAELLLISNHERKTEAPKEVTDHWAAIQQGELPWGYEVWKDTNLQKPIH